MEEALDDDNFSFSGSFFHAGLLSSSPNPYLNITGLGIVGLPLSDRDAKAIIPCATLAPFGKGERTVVDKEVRDTWEIEPAKISFANPQWDRYVKDVVCVEVCKSLGVNLVHARPRMELYKMLLYEKGSQYAFLLHLALLLSEKNHSFLPHQEFVYFCITFSETDSHLTAPKRRMECSRLSSSSFLLHILEDK